LARLDLRFLGPFQADLGGLPVEGFDSNKVRALLVYLVMERARPHSREVLAGMLWPEQSQQSAMDNLRYALADLRRVLGDTNNPHPFLIVSREMIQFDPASDFWLDTAEFGRLSMAAQEFENGSSPLPAPNLKDAVELYQGSFLEGFTVSNSAPFEEWLLSRREQLQRDLVRDLEFLADYYERQGLYSRALQAAWKQVELEPWYEEAHQQIIRLLAFDGQRSSAIAQYETIKATLSRELGIEPSPETTRLYQSIRDGVLYIPPHFTQPGFLELETPPSLSPPPFFGREEELDAMSRCLHRTLGWDSSIILVTGEAGSGKTALVKEFIQQSLQQTPDLVAAFTNCNAFTGASDPYLPFIELLEMLTGDVDRAWMTGSGSRLEAARLWSAAPEAIQALAENGADLIGRFLHAELLLARTQALPHPQTGRLEILIQRNASRMNQTLPAAGSMQQSALYDQVLSVFRWISRQRPLILAIDDLQWADTDTINLLFYISRRLTASRIMIIGIYRQEFHPRIDPERMTLFQSLLGELRAQSGTGYIDLSQSNSRQFIQALVDSQPNRFGNDFRDTLAQVTGGIPLFAIELLRAMQSRGDLAQDENGQWIETNNLNWELLPSRVEAVIAEQVGHLPQEWQQILNIASVEGEEFTAEVIARILFSDPGDMVQNLSRAISPQGQIISATGLHHPGVEGMALSSYRFRHHLFQEYFYQMQDRVERGRLHEAVGKALESLYGAQADEIALSLAFHFELASNNQKAANYLLLAGKKAVTLFANEQAITHLKKGLRLLDAVSQTHERDLLELKFLAALGSPLITIQGYTSPELEEVFNRAQNLVRKGMDEVELIWVLSLLKSYYNIRGDPDNSRVIADQTLKMANRSKRLDLRITAHSRMIANCFYYAQWEALEKHLKQTIRLYDLGKHRGLTNHLGSDPKGNAYSYAAIVYWIIGYPDQAARYSQQAIHHADELNNPMVSWFACYFEAHLYSYTGDIQKARQVIEKALEICDEQDLAYYRIYTRTWSGWIKVKEGDETGLSLMEENIDRMRLAGDRMNLLLFLRLFADACMGAHRLERVLDTVSEALDLCEKTEIVYEKSELLRLKGEILLADSQDNIEEAESCFIQAIECAEQQNSKMWQLRAAMSLARLWMHQEKMTEAQKILLDIFGWFSEGFDTLDLREARSLLNVST
jgi:DNA-binding SARP family transcriptional activator